MTQKKSKKKVQRVFKNGTPPGVVIKYLTDSHYQKLTKNKPVRFMVAGITVEVRRKDDKLLREIARKKAELRNLQRKLKGKSDETVPTLF